MVNGESICLCDDFAEVKVPMDAETEESAEEKLGSTRIRF